MNIIYPQGLAEFTVPDTQKVSVYSLDVCDIFTLVGFPNYPSVWKLLASTVAGTQYVSAGVSGDTRVRVAARAAQAVYVVGASPSATDPTADINAADATFDIAGLAAAQGGYVKATGGTSTTAANAGGAVSIVGGAPGVTGVGGAANVTGGAGGATSGSGGAVNVTGGAGTNGNANGGSVIVGGGAANGSGAGGVIIERTIKMVRQAAPAAKTTSATLTAAEVLAGIITVAQGAAGTSALQLPLATAMDTALPDAAASDAFDFSVINTSTVDAEDASVTTNTGWTLVGAMDLPAYSTGTNASLNSSGRFRARKTGAGAWTLYRLS